MKEGDKIPLAPASASRTQRGQCWPPQAKAGGKNTSFLGAHLLSCCCSCSQGTFLCSGKQELCARHSRHLRGPGGRRGQARQLPLARQELTEKAGSLLSNTEFLSQTRLQIPFAGSKASLFLVGSSFSEAHLGKKEGDLGTARLRGTAGPQPAL